MKSCKKLINIGKLDSFIAKDKKDYISETYSINNEYKHTQNVFIIKVTGLFERIFLDLF
jgi:hypothetical protein